MKNEKQFKAFNGYIILFVVLALITGLLLLMAATNNPAWIALGFIIFMLFPGFMTISPNQSAVLTLFGKYKGSILDNGFWWINPFMKKRKISLRARNFNSDTIKVNDKIGNPIMIGAVVVWKVMETFKAAFEVDDFEHFVMVQTDAAVRKLAGIYPYDNFEDENAKLTLRDGSEEVNKQLELEISNRLKIAGIEVLEARINHLAYATEIAGAMLKRQQAVAIIAARTKIVEGAVSMVEMALSELSNKGIVELDEERKAQMVSNLMVVLTSDKDVSPVVNTGSIY
jgi:regulator of protease activity HflC (stomatin/prohibitin superfamily)